MNKGKVKKTLVGIFATAVLAASAAIPAGAAFPGYIGSTQTMTLSPGQAAAQLSTYEGSEVTAEWRCLPTSSTSMSYILRYSSSGPYTITVAKGTNSAGSGWHSTTKSSPKSTFWNFVIFPSTGTNAKGEGKLTVNS